MGGYALYLRFRELVGSLTRSGGGVIVRELLRGCDGIPGEARPPRKLPLEIPHTGFVVGKAGGCRPAQPQRTFRGLRVDETAAVGRERAGHLRRACHVAVAIGWEAQPEGILLAHAPKRRLVPPTHHAMMDWVGVHGRCVVDYDALRALDDRRQSRLVGGPLARPQQRPCFVLPGALERDGGFRGAPR